MTKQFVENSKKFLEENEITLMHHPDKRTLLKELLKLYRWGFVPEERLYKFCDDIAATGFKPSFFDHTINCCLWRNCSDNVTRWNEEYWRWYVDYELFHGCQITSAIAEFLVYNKRLPRVPLQVDLSKSTRSKPYDESYEFTMNENEKQFTRNARRILRAAV